MHFMAYGSKLQLESGSFLEVLYDVYIGVVVGASHSLWLSFHVVYSSLSKPLLRFFGRSLYKDTKRNDEGLKVVAVGYGRTGTYSLTLALEELGYPTLHTQHLYENDEVQRMWTNEIFLPSIKANKASLGRPNFDLIASNYKATADLPVALYYEQIMEQYPDCKFILTTRENSEVWFRSWDTLTRSITQPALLGGLVFSNVKQYTFYLRWLFAIVNKDNNFLTVPFPLPDQDKASAIASYEDHNRRVRNAIPPNQLLEYNVREGWAPLCSFLEIQHCPDTPFPKTNSARSVQVQSISAFIVPLSIVLFCLFYAFANGFKRLTGRTVLQWTRLQLNVLLTRCLLFASHGNKKVYWATAVDDNPVPIHKKTF